MLANAKELVVNWHITEACNYKCEYCFAKWEKKTSKEIFHIESKIEILLNQIEKIKFILNNHSSLIKFNHLRLNLVGGEIFLYRKELNTIINLSKKHNFKLSAITNGSLFDDENIQLISKNFCSIGISVDSLKDDTNFIIGRSSKKETFNSRKVIDAINLIKQKNPNIDIKINTVVNSQNISEDLNSFISQVQPNKWKIFKILPVYSKKLEISEKDFNNFLDKHKNFKEIISFENNDTMIDSYLMIDPIGRIFQNGLNQGYNYSLSLCEISAEEALKQINFDKQKFLNRYKHII